MTTEEFYTVWSDAELRQAIVDMAKAFSRSKEVQEQLYYRAWYFISERRSGRVDEYYIGCAYASMRHRYEICHMPIPRTYRSKDPGNRRAKRKLIKYIKSGEKSLKSVTSIDRGTTWDKK